MCCTNGLGIHDKHRPCIANASMPGRAPHTPHSASPHSKHDRRRCITERFNNGVATADDHESRSPSLDGENGNKAPTRIPGQAREPRAPRAFVKTPIHAIYSSSARSSQRNAEKKHNCEPKPRPGDVLSPARSCSFRAHKPKTSPPKMPALHARKQPRYRRIVHPHGMARPPSARLSPTPRRGRTPPSTQAEAASALCRKSQSAHTAR